MTRPESAGGGWPGAKVRMGSQPHEPTHASPPVPPPRLHADVHLRYGAGDEVIVKDTRSSRVFRLDAATAAVLELLDGTRSSKQLAARLSAPTEAIDDLIARLDQSGLLVGGASTRNRNSAMRAAEASGRERGRIAAALSNLVLVTVPLVRRPDRVLQALADTGFVRGLLSPVGLGVLAGVPIAAAVALATQGLNAVGGSVAAGLMWPQLLTLPVVWLLAKATHELAHGLVCARLGGHVGTFGVGFYLLMPVFYVDVNDAWLFGRRDRALTHLAGAGVDGLVASAAYLATASTATLPGQGDAVVGQVLLVTGVSVVFNLNPLLRLDGYYVLADMLGIDGLRRRALHELPRQLRAWANERGGPVAEARSSVATSLRERRILLAYGVGAYLALLLLGGYLMWRLGWLFDHLGASYARLPIQGLIALGVGSLVWGAWRSTTVRTVTPSEETRRT